MAISVKLEAFEGPLDLLLHLIEKNKIDIYDIPIVEITAQYLDYIKQMQREDMNVMSEFLVMAATLIDIKCKMLLPKEVNEDGEEEDPRAELVQKLLEYKMYKYMSFELRDRQVDAERNMYREQRLPKEVEAYRQPIDYEELIGDMNLNKLHEIFKSIVKKQEDKIDPAASTAILRRMRWTWTSRCCTWRRMPESIRPSASGSFWRSRTAKWKSSLLF